MLVDGSIKRSLQEAIANAAAAAAAADITTTNRCHRLRREDDDVNGVTSRGPDGDIHRGAGD